MLENRKFPRVKHTGICIMTRESDNDIETWQVDLVNLSINGALISCPDNWPGSVKDNLRLTLILENVDVELKIDACVAHQTPIEIGVEFLSLNVESAQTLKNLIAISLNSEVNIC
ncbi:MAG: PilZ domain-containing protein [Psychromonas sp.]